MPAYHKKPEESVPVQIAQPSMSMRELAQSTALEDRNTSYTVRLASVEEVNPPRGMRGYRVMRGRTQTDENRHQHNIRVFFAKDEPLTRDTKVIVDCTCPRHAFYYEVANAKRGASFVYRSNGENPTKTNPSLRPGLCKHAYRTLYYMLKMRWPAKGAKPNPAARAAPAPPRRVR